MTRRIGHALTWALAAFGALCLLLTLAGIVAGARPLVVRTGSMAPALPVGTVAIVRPAAATSARVGDVVAVRRSDGRRIMHRVRSVRPAGGHSATLVLRGDRNRRADPPLTVSRIERPLVVVPWAGTPIEWLDGPWLQFWLGVATGSVALAWLAGRRSRPSRRSRSAAHRGPHPLGPRSPRS